MPKLLILCGKISGSHGGEYENVFLDVAPCSLVESDRCFKCAYCLHHNGAHPTKRNNPEYSDLDFLFNLF
jgi:hypothetical protein